MVWDRFLRVATLDEVIREGFLEKVSLSKGLKDKGKVCADLEKHLCPGRKESECKGPEAGVQPRTRAGKHGGRGRADGEDEGQGS